MTSSISCQCSLQISLAGEGTLRHPRVEGFTPRLSPQSSACHFRALRKPPAAGRDQPLGICPWGAELCWHHGDLYRWTGGRCCDSLKVPSAACPSICSRAPIPQCFHPSIPQGFHPSLSASCVEHRGSPSSDTPRRDKRDPGEVQPFRLWAHGEQLGWAQGGRHWVCWHPAWGCGDPLRTPRLPRAGQGWHLPFPAGPWPAGAAPSPLPAGRVQLVRQRSEMKAGASGGLERSQAPAAALPCSPRAATSELGPGCSTASKSLGD